MDGSHGHGSAVDGHRQGSSRDGRVGCCSAESGNGPHLSLWCVALDSFTSTDLSPLERARAEHLLRPRDRARFIAAHSSLRRLLAAELDCAPGEVPIVIGDRGKPRLADGKPRLAGTTARPGAGDLRFSSSRSAGMAVHAISWDMEIGVDLEAIRPNVDVETLGARFFSARERALLDRLAPTDRLAGALRCWTRKEAYAKATGQGLSMRLDSLEVGIGGSCMTGDGWSIHQVEIAPGFAAAVAGWQPGGWDPAGGELRAMWFQPEAQIELQATAEGDRGA